MMRYLSIEDKQTGYKPNQLVISEYGGRSGDFDSTDGFQKSICHIYRANENGELVRISSSVLDGKKVLYVEDEGDEYANYPRGVYQLEKVPDDEYDNVYFTDVSADVVICNDEKVKGVYVYDAETENFIKVETGGSESSGGDEITCESHTLTAEEATAESFMLANSIKTGKETDVFLSVCGMVQIAGVDYTASGNAISWSGKTLEDVGLQAGDVFLVQYVKG